MHRTLRVLCPLWPLAVLVLALLAVLAVLALVGGYTPPEERGAAALAAYQARLRAVVDECRQLQAAGHLPQPMPGWPPGYNRCEGLLP